jgi:NTE family protein
MQNGAPLQTDVAVLAVRQDSFVRVHASIIEEDMRVALVLSAGGMFGAYQAGAWEVLGEFLKPEIVIGTSIGSLHAWAIAGGATGAELMPLWYDASLGQAIRWQFPRTLRHGILHTHALEERIQNLHQTFTPDRPVGIVANAYPRLRPQLFRDQEITWQHLAASCAVPFFLRQPQIGGFTYADGGLFDSLNVWAAFQMGATHAVVINCWKPRQPWIIDKPVGWFAARRRREASSIPQVAQPQNRVVVIEPDSTLGRMRDSMYWRRSLIDEWRERGQADAARNKQIICDMF